MIDHATMFGSKEAENEDESYDNSASHACKTFSTPLFNSYLFYQYVLYTIQFICN